MAVVDDSEPRSSDRADAPASTTSLAFGTPRGLKSAARNVPHVIYARMDEAGTPSCVRLAGQTKQDGTVTLRDRNDASQIRIDKSRCVEYLHQRLGL